MRQYVTFILRVFIKYWFLAPLAAQAPTNDLKFLKELVHYREINQSVAGEVLNTFKHHLWYLNEMLVGLSFFDREIDMPTKKKMIKALEKAGHIEMPRRPQIDITKIKDIKLTDFISKNTCHFFKTLFDQNIVAISTDFLKIDPSKWFNDENYLKAENIVKHLLVVNDAAERAIQLIKDYNEVVLKDEEQKQYLFQVVEKYRKDIKTPTPKKLQSLENTNTGLSC